MARRLLDVTLAALGLALTAPLLAVAAVGIVLSSPGPIIYRATRLGRGGRRFIMFKLRTMRAAPPAPGERASAITAWDDPRVFPLGGWLRRTKLDELPQLVNVLRGDMAIVGPRPEDPKFVAGPYATLYRETLRVRPGLASPGSLFSSTHGETWLSSTDAERDYVEKLLPLKLALDAGYVRRASLRYDLTIMLRTLRVLAARALGRTAFAEPPELADAERLLAGLSPAPQPASRSAPVTPSVPLARGSA
jgi:lipopolysaccharide/colanic/teichoic acid biosynthesis glycosyltransferase